jgi:peptidoglycan/xylan/chitin deacetylase (PgdA/CDA1 family)
LRRLAASGIVEIGGHTETHPVLAELSPDAQSGEIAGAKAALEKFTGRRVESFAYPYGGRNEYDASAVEAVRRAGYHRACANVQAPVHAGVDRFELPRLIVGDWEGSTFARRLETWLGQVARRKVAGPA